MVVRQFFPWAGGTERQAQKLACALQRAGAEVRVLTGRWTRGVAREEVIGGVPVLRHSTWYEFFGLKGFRKFGAYIYLVSLLWHLFRLRKTYDVVHVHMLSYPAFSGVLAARWFGKKSLVKMANSGPGSDIRRMENNALIPGQRRMLPTTLEADRLIAINNTIVTELSVAGVSAERIAVIPNGVDFENATPRSDYLTTGQLTVVFVGRLVPNKGADVLLPAFRRVLNSQTGTPWRLWLFGEGSERASLEAMCVDLGIAEHVKFWGRIDSVASHLEQADLFVLPSRAEGMSNALLEAMSHGLPCVASRIPGNVEVLRDGENGILVPVDNDKALADALVELGRDPDRRKALGEQARSDAINDFAIDSVASRYLELYRELLHQTSSSPPVAEHA